MKKSQFNKDLEVEDIISKWIEKHYFEKKSNPYKYTRCNIIEYQERGIDAALKNPKIFNDNEHHFIDEKAASSYIKTNIKENNIPTFAFELDCKRKGSLDREDRVPGWLFGNKYEKTEYYLLSWVWADINNINDKNNLGNKKQIELNNITKIKCFLVAKEAIQKFVERFGISKENFMSKAKEVRLKNQKKVLLSNGKTPNLQYSKQLEECPVNIVISEYHLKKMAIDRFTILR